MGEWIHGAPGIEEFRSFIRQQGERLYRDLPWRNVDDPYAVLVSEVMLQQTQVKRVLGKWEQWMGRYPTVDALAAAATSDVLESWQGLGYNRRALALKRAAEQCSAQYEGALPGTVEGLIALPGIGPATAGGVVAFAYQKPVLYLETNVRTVFLHELFPGEQQVSDKRIAPLVEAACPAENVRAWYYALLDYGAHLKTQVENPSRRSAHYGRQSVFEGSRRQKRAETVRFVLASAEKGCTFEDVVRCLAKFERDRGRDAVDADTVASILSDLEGEGFFHKKNERYFS